MMEDIPPHSPVLEKDGIWIIATCPEFPGANGQGKTETEALKSLAHAVETLEEDRKHDEIFDK